MERIKQALEKARQQRTTAPLAQPSPRKGIAPQPAEAALSEVNYVETNVLKLQPAHLEKMRIVAFNKGDPISIHFDILRTQVLSKMEEHGWRTIAITSPVPGCGKTVVSINLAMSIAQHTKKTAMLVDFDLRRPSVSKYLGFQPDKSLNDVLDGGEDISNVLVNPGIPKLVILPTAKPFSRPAETLSSAKVEHLIRDLRERYHERVVLFDLPPILSADDVITVLPHVDCVLMVVGNGMVTKTELEDSLRHLQGANLLGVVLNKAEAGKSSYYY